MKKILLMASALAFAGMFSGCANVAVQDASPEGYAKEFNPPPAGWAGLYLYRSCNILSASFKKGLYIDGQYIGDSSRCRFFYRLVRPGEHTIQTESEFGENDVKLRVEEGRNYYVNQYLRPGILLLGAEVDLEDEKSAQEDIVEYSLAENMDDPKKDLDNYTGGAGQGSIPGPRNAHEAKILATK
ncbi:MAG: DUF2846 domain-containing protein [Succinivibrionaceae bacterium]|nr:DUF2846 domain-containing protein [Succinivibrionaceae bacterium]